MTTIGDRIKERRIAIGMSVQTLASKIGKSLATVYRYENNEVEGVPVDVLKPLASALGVTPEYLVGWETNSNSFKNLHPLTPYTKLPKLGVIHAGEPVSTYQDESGEWCYADKKYGDGRYYMLDVVGDSMSPTVPDGSEAIILQQPFAERGEIVAFALNGDEATLKRYYPQPDGTILLRGDNPNADSYTITQQQLENGDAFILGILVEYKVKIRRH